MTPQYIILAILAAVNIITFFIMGNDKRKSIQGGNTERTPEGIIFFMAAVGGSFGVYLAMLTFRHKTRKWYFKLGIPLLILQNTATAYVMWQLVAVN